MTLDDCKNKALGVKIFYDSTSHICDFSCQRFSGKNFILDFAVSPIECKSSCDFTNYQNYKYYYEGIFRCLDKCPYFYDGNTNKCLDKCSPSDNKYVDGEKCVTTCGSEKYIIRENYKTNIHSYYQDFLHQYLIIYSNKNDILLIKL